MMTRRILKKKSKQARDILIAHYRYKPEDFFLAERGDSYHGMNIRCGHRRKPGRFTCECQTHPLPGTPMLGGMSGGEEPEWSERTAFFDLQGVITWSDRPLHMSDKDWHRALAVSRAAPISDDDIAAMLADDEAVG